MNLPSKGKIASLTCQRALPDDRAISACWVRADNAHSTPDSDSTLVPIDRCSSALPQVGAEDAVFVLLGPEFPKELLVGFIQSAANKEARVYVLAIDGQLEERSALEELERFGARILIREVSTLAVSGILVNRGSQGGLFLAPSAQSSPKWWLALSPEQGQAAFRYALHEFWHRASSEGWATPSGIDFRTPRARPFDIPLQSRQAPVRPCSSFPKGAGQCWYSPTGQIPDGDIPRQVVVHPSGESHGQLSKFVRGDSQVCWSDVALPAVALDGDSGTLMLGAGLRVELIPRQVEVIRGLVDTAIKSPEWRFSVDVQLVDLNSGSKIFLPKAEEAVEVIDNQTIECDPVDADSLRKMPEEEPASIREVPPFVRSGHWTWTVRPPRVPKSAKQDSLVVQWQEFDADIQARLNRAQKLLDECKPEIRGGKLDKLDRQTKALLDKIPSTLGPDGAKKMQDDVRRLQEELRELGVDDGRSDKMSRDRKGGKKKNKVPFVPQSRKQRSEAKVPIDALPSVGELRKHEGQLYLVIDSWEQLAEGEEEAVRLKAHLVAPAEER